uniref:NAD(P)-binding domain-containing protein n=1 Tax=Ornithorhynchus anatinus TaxID=9258 RepID=K7E6I7_ORNAN
MAAAGKKIVIFGATGRTGLSTLAQAIKAGYKVTVLIRDPARLPAELQPTRVLVGDVLKPSDVDQVVSGQDAVIVLLGTGNDLSPTTVMSEGTKNIVAAMKAHGVGKVVACTSGDKPLTGDYKLSLDAPGGPGSSRVISKDDLGHFMLRCVDTDEFDGHSVYLSGQYS